MMMKSLFIMIYVYHTLGEDSDLDMLIDCILANLNANMSSKAYITS